MGALLLGTSPAGPTSRGTSAPGGESELTETLPLDSITCLFARWGLEIPVIQTKMFEFLYSNVPGAGDQRWGSCWMLSSHSLK